MPINENENILLNRKFAPKLLPSIDFAPNFVIIGYVPFYPFFCITRRLAFEIKRRMQIFGLYRANTSFTAYI